VGDRSLPRIAFCTEKQPTQAKEESIMSFWEIALAVLALPTIIVLAILVDKKSDWEEDLEDEEVRPLLGVVAPKKEEKEEK
jgi:capsular polysaccharide biosynthesis protein